VGALIVWLLVLSGGLELPSTFGPISWHAHEMLYGFVAAVIAGFLLTAIPNWTGRMPLQGAPLLALILLWVAGRVAMATSSWIEGVTAAVVDLGFLTALFAVVAREIVAGRNWRNLPMASAVLALAVANALAHGEAMGWMVDRGLGWRLGLAVVLMLIGLVGGRIIPSFTRNWLAKRGSGRLPRSFGAADKAALATTGLALALWVASPETRLTGGVLLIAAVCQAARLARWCGHRTLAEPLVWVLHLAYAWLPVGLGLLAAAIWAEGSQTLAIHALTAGAIGTITLAVMTRATLGHTGRALHADAATTAIYAAVTLATAFRLAAAALADHTLALLIASTFCWVLAFGGFAIVYGRYLLQARSSAA
jgi:uncharacterized protein involved in response to NO